MTDKEKVTRQFNHQETDDCPYTLQLERPLSEKLDGTFRDWESSIRNSIITVGCFDTWDTLRPLGDGRQVDAYGSIWKKTEDISHLNLPVLQECCLEEYRFPCADIFCVPETYEAMKNRTAAYNDRYLVGNIGAGFYELTWRLLGIEDTFVAMLTEPEMIRKILDELMQLLCSFVDIICTLPIDAVMVGDDWADQRGIMFGAERWREIFKPYYKKLYAYIHAKGKKTITHSCGSVTEVIPDLIDIGLDVLESVQPEAKDMNPYMLKQTYGKELCFWGGLGCQRAVTYFTPDELRKEIRRLKTEMTIGGGYILAPSKTLNSTVPIENAKVILEEFTGDRLELWRLQ